MYNPPAAKPEEKSSPAKLSSFEDSRLAQASAFKVEAVIVCDQYADFLGQVLPTNKYLFDKLVIVTSPEDLKTQRICEFHHVECVVTDALQSRWKEFHKGAGINIGLDKLSKSGWVAHIDADMYLPPQTRILLERANLDPACIYGIDRFIVRGYAAWDRFRSLPDLQHECDAYVHLGAFPMGTRVMHSFAGGYVPIGFFQLWHPTASGVCDYPAEHTTAGRGDTIHAQRWNRSQRGFIPELVGYHLESDDAKMASNWSGRTSSRFGPLPFTDRAMLLDDQRFDS